jgi:hypothetical protein
MYSPLFIFIAIAETNEGGSKETMRTALMNEIGRSVDNDDDTTSTRAPSSRHKKLSRKVAHPMRGRDSGRQAGAFDALSKKPSTLMLGGHITLSILFSALAPCPSRRTRNVRFIYIRSIAPSLLCARMERIPLVARGRAAAGTLARWHAGCGRAAPIECGLPA